MKDSVTGLTIASTNHLPSSLRETVLLGLPADSYPLVYFCEVARKISRGGANRFTKERLVMVTKDALLLYAMDGTIKRRIRIQDINAIVLAQKMFDPLHWDANSFETVGIAAVGIIVPNQYDCAFEFVFDPKQRAARREGKSPGSTPPASGTPTPRSVGSNPAPQSPRSIGVEQAVAASVFTEQATNRLIRALTILARRNPADPELNIYRIRQVSPLQAFTALHENLTLKKPAGTQPPLPPTIDYISSETQKQRTLSDGRLQVEEILTDLLNELAKYSAETTTEYNSTYYEQLLKVAQVEREECQLLRERASLDTEVRTRQRVNSERQEILVVEDNEAREALLALHEKLARIQQQHSDDVDEIRASIEATEKRIADLKSKQEELQRQHIEKLRSLDSHTFHVADEIKRATAELEQYKAWPTIDELRRECSRYQERLDEIRASQAEYDKLDEEQQASKAEIKTLRKENEALEKEILTQKQFLREEQTHREQLALTVSALFAKRNRLAKDAEWKEKETNALSLDIDQLEEELVQQQELNNVLQLRLSLVDAEAAVCEDLSREATIHDSIARSVADVALLKERSALEEESELQRQIEDLSSQVRLTSPNILSLRSTPRLASATPRLNHSPGLGAATNSARGVSSEPLPPSVRYDPGADFGPNSVFESINRTPRSGGRRSARSSHGTPRSGLAVSVTSPGTQGLIFGSPNRTSYGPLTNFMDAGSPTGRGSVGVAGSAEKSGRFAWVAEVEANQLLRSGRK